MEFYLFLRNLIILLFFLLSLTGKSKVSDLDFSSSAITASVNFSMTDSDAANIGAVSPDPRVGQLVGAVEITVVQDVVIDIWRTPGAVLKYIICGSGSFSTIIAIDIG